MNYIVRLNDLLKSYFAVMSELLIQQKEVMCKCEWDYYESNYWVQVRKEYFWTQTLLLLSISSHYCITPSLYFT